ncbi:MAG: hypothetical protein U0521_17525 [Anaerolineae bacterium]
MRFRALICLLLVLFAGCQGPPPTVVYIVVTATPETTLDANAAPTVEPTITETATAVVPTATAVPPTPTTAIAATATSASTTSAVPTESAPTALPPGFPTPVIAQVQVAEQLFEHGRMFWLEPIQQIWVLKITGEGHGTWSVYEDTFVDGEPETDPSLVPPEGRYQPERGFGKLWRESPGLREELGWGVTPEFGYVSNYEYHSGGYMDANGTYVREGGYHIVYSLAGEQFRFDESDGTWRLGTN